jgi:hypothetical protein
MAGPVNRSRAGRAALVRVIWMLSGVDGQGRNGVLDGRSGRQHPSLAEDVYGFNIF